MRPAEEKEQQDGGSEIPQVIQSSIKVGKKAGEASWKATSDLCFMAVTLALFLKRIRGRFATENIFKGGGMLEYTRRTY